MVRSFMLLLFIIVVCTFLPIFILSTSDTSYDDCSPFKCGNINFSFPFYSHLNSICGLPGFEISCENSSSDPRLLLSGRLYHVKNLEMTLSNPISDSSLMNTLITVVDPQLVKDLTAGSCESFYNLSIANTSTGSLNLPPGSANLTLFKCPKKLSLSKEFTDKVVNNVSCNDGDQLYVWRNRTQFDPPLFNSVVLAPSGCLAVFLPVSGFGYLLLNASDADQRTKLIQVLDAGFLLGWKWSNIEAQEACEECHKRRGRCGYDGSLKKVVCFCKGGCEKSKRKKQLFITGN
ncbi:hypothetical protein Patl1_15046 [Pistacia atlantica]|uniref:Uncharacterized protein n=1 Tax=Pistacia atlantica TaxID=434234 RepID=A0ACC1BAZ1_9ROSI|nr:hypothetical protein Patl1_15046 [Pistacia atlantica]